MALLSPASLALLCATATTMLAVESFAPKPSTIMNHQPQRSGHLRHTCRRRLRLMHLNGVFNNDADESTGQFRSVANNNKNTNPKNDPEWRFLDRARMHVTGGPGGNGCVAMRREKGEPMGGPSGGRGGRGGDVYLEAAAGVNTLLNIQQQHVHVKAHKGLPGQGKSRDGKGGKSITIKVPLGTIIRDLESNKVAGELLRPGDKLIVAKGGRGGRGNKAFATTRNTAPKMAERGEPGAARWLALELRLIANVGLLGKPNAGKSTLLAATTAAKPKIANYPFTTVEPNLGVCNVLSDENNKEGSSLVICDIPGLIEGAAEGAGMGDSFLRHVQRCQVLLHVVDGSSDDPVGDFNTIQRELKGYDSILAQKPQVVVLNKVDITDVNERQDELIQALKQAAGHSRVLPISAATTSRVRELMQRLHKFVTAEQEKQLEILLQEQRNELQALNNGMEDVKDKDDLSLLRPSFPTEVDLGLTGLDYDSDDYEIQSDPAYPGQWRIVGKYIEQTALMTIWEYAEAVQRFGRILTATGMAEELTRRGAVEGDLIMIGDYDFEFSPNLTNPYIPEGLLEQEKMFFDEQRNNAGSTEEEEQPWRPFPQGGFLDVDMEELEGFTNESGDWDLLEEDGDGESKYDFFENDSDDDFFLSDDDEIWTS